MEYRKRRLLFDRVMGRKLQRRNRSLFDVLQSLRRTGDDTTQLPARVLRDVDTTAADQVPTVVRELVQEQQELIQVR